MIYYHIFKKFTKSGRVTLVTLKDFIKSEEVPIIVVFEKRKHFTGGREEIHKDTRKPAINRNNENAGFKDFVYYNY